MRSAIRIQLLKAIRSSIRAVLLQFYQDMIVWKSRIILRADFGHHPLVFPTILQFYIHRCNSCFTVLLLHVYGSFFYIYSTDMIFVKIFTLPDFGPIIFYPKSITRNILHFGTEVCKILKTLPKFGWIVDFAKV